MKTTYRPTAADKKLIREAAVLASKQKKVTLRVGVMANADQSVEGESFNALLVADSRANAGTIDNMPWADFCKANSLTADGRGVFDIAVYEMPLPGQPQDFYLVTHVAVIVEGAKLARVEYHTGQRLVVLNVVDGAFV